MVCRVPPCILPAAPIMHLGSVASCCGVPFNGSRMRLLSRICAIRKFSTFNLKTCRSSGNLLPNNSVGVVRQYRVSLSFSSMESNVPGFCLLDYDCVGFDLDNTICRYNLNNVLKLIYDTMCNYLVKQKGYSSSLLQLPFDEGSDFLLKGLALDVRRGNLLKVGLSGSVLRASHGTRMMTPEEIDRVYGTSRTWEPLVTFKNALCDPTEGVRFYKDYFEMPSILVTARLVDIVDRDGSQPTRDFDYSIVDSDILEALKNSFRMEAATGQAGGFFPAVLGDVSRYLQPCSEALKAWLRAIKKVRPLFLVTSSKEDYVAFVAEHCLGADWESYFDIRVTYARKPGFFTGNREFVEAGLTCEHISDHHPKTVNGEALQRDRTYAQGNYAALLAFFRKLTQKNDPRVLYFGDHLLFDVAVPARYSRCHAVAILEELEAEGMGAGVNGRHPDGRCITSSKWGSFFYDTAVVEACDSTVSGVRRINTLWADVAVNYSQIAVPGLDALAELPLDTRLESFDVTQQIPRSGFYPGDPKSLHG